MRRNTQVIAEVKTRSPFGFVSEKSWDELFAVADEIGDIVSIHTDSRWGGSFELLEKARLLTGKPILAKGIHATDEEVSRALKCGANYVLVVGRVPAAHAERCLVEPLTLGALKEIPEGIKAVWNSRDLASGNLKDEGFGQARKIFRGWLCQASNIATVEDIEEEADAVLVGTNLLKFARSLKACGDKDLRSEV